jgi:cysteine desulfurase / selenocysteine lyase
MSGSPTTTSSSTSSSILHQLNVEALRAATPGCLDVAFLNNAGSALPTTETLEATISHLRREAVIGGYKASDEATGVIQEARATAARLIGAQPHEIALTASDTAGFAKVFWGMVNGGMIPKGARVVVDQVSYNSHYMALLQLQRTHNIKIDVLPSNVDGSIDVTKIDETLDRPTALVMSTTIGTHCGLINPIAGVGAACKARSIIHMVDACQAIGQLPVNVDDIACDVLTSTGRKWLRGPRGTGLLYVRDSLAERCDPPGLDGVSGNWIDAYDYSLVSGAMRFEEFETCVAARVGFANALSELEGLGVQNVRNRLVVLSEHLREGLHSVGAIAHDGDGERSAIVSWSVPGLDPTMVVEAANRANITINASTAAFARLDMVIKHQTSVVRAAPHIYNTTEELDRLIAVVGKLI